ncbi:MAG TPA: hypothetical protein VGZ69_07450 [Candidatus Rhabdochlamydia sp.]|nr:hypothetical protein [Candidatus Rhabdochlamydia sp.]
MTSLNTVGSSNEIYPSLISFCNEIALNRDKVAKVVAVIASDHFKNRDNLKNILEGVIRGDNPEVVQVLITSDNFENRHLFDRPIQ